ncbi:MAG: redoxin domain-containing protein [Synergistales bacterium]|nr:redoxin domain-containing protein [Synergistales bacterium]
MITTGEKIPDFCLKDQSGSSICSGDLTGKWAVFFIYVKDSTPG